MLRKELPISRRKEKSESWQVPRETADGQRDFRGKEMVRKPELLGQGEVLWEAVCEREERAYITGSEEI